MRKGVLQIVAMIGVLVIMVVVIVFYSGSLLSNSSPTATPVVTPTPTVMPTINMLPTPTGNTTAPNAHHTVTYSELSRNETMIVIQFKLEPNSYIFQLNATSVYLRQDNAIISANTNGAVIIGTQYWSLFFPINGYNGTDYRLSSNGLPLDTVWIKQ